MNISYIYPQPDSSDYLPVYIVADLLRQIITSHRYLVAILKVPVISGYSLNRQELTFTRLIKEVYRGDDNLIIRLKESYCEEHILFSENDIFLIFLLLELSGSNINKVVKHLNLTTSEREFFQTLINKYQSIDNVEYILENNCNAKGLREFLREKRKKSTKDPLSQFIDNVINEIGYESFVDLEVLLRSRDLTYSDVATKFINKSNNQRGKDEDQALLLVTEWEFTSALVIGIMHSKEFIRGSESLKNLHCARQEHDDNYTFQNFAMVYATINLSVHKQAKNSEILGELCKNDMGRLVELQEQLSKNPRLLKHYHRA